MKSITLILIFSFSLAHLPKGSTTIGGWGYYSKQTNLCDDCFTLSISPEINYFFTSYYSLDIDLDLIKTHS